MSFSQGHALLIGVGDYKHYKKLAVPHTIRDVHAIEKVLLNPKKCGYPSDQVQLLAKDKATKDNIEQAFINLAQRTTADSTVFIFLASHGFFGTNDKWYFKPHDVVLEGEYVRPETGISESRFTELLHDIPAERLIIFMNTCFSGNFVTEPGNLRGSVEAAEPSATARPTQDGLNAMLGSGKGRIIITAAGDTEKSYFDRFETNSLTFFGKAIVEGLSGKGARNNGGFISAFDLYSQIYLSVTDTMEEYGDAYPQSPEFTVRKAVGPFPLALHRGKPGDLKSFDESRALPEEGVENFVVVPEQEIEQSLQTVMGDRLPALQRNNLTLADDHNEAHESVIGDGNVVIKNNAFDFNDIGGSVSINIRSK